MDWHLTGFTSHLGIETNKFFCAQHISTHTDTIRWGKHLCIFGPKGAIQIRYIIMLITYTEAEVIFVLLVNFIRKVFSCRLRQLIFLIKNIKYSRSLSFNQVCLHQHKNMVQHVDHHSWGWRYFQQHVHEVVYKLFCKKKTNAACTNYKCFKQNIHLHRVWGKMNQQYFGHNSDKFKHTVVIFL